MQAAHPTVARELTARLSDLLRRERTAMCEFLVALAEFDRRKLWVELGHPNLFSFLRRDLGLSAGAAHYRKVAAELMQRFPQVEAAIRDGKLCLSSIVELGKVLTAENAAEVLPRFFGLSSREAALVAVEIRPARTIPEREVITAADTATSAREVRGSIEPQASSDATPFRASEAVRAASTVPPETATTSAQKTVEPLDAGRVRLHLTVSRKFLEKLQRTRDALSHSHAGASIEEVLDACLDLALKQHAKRRGLVKHPRKPVRAAGSTAIPAAVKRDVWRRANGRCEWPLDRGGVCGSTRKLEFAHVVPRARGGPPTRENLKLHCRAHNVIAARRDYGDEVVDRYAKRRETG